MSDPFGGRYHDQGIGGMDRRYVSGMLVSVGHLLGWSAVLVPLLVFGLVGAAFISVDYGWVMPTGAPSLPMAVLVCAGMFLGGAITAAIGRSRVRKLRPWAGVIWYVVAAGMLLGGSAWLIEAYGIPV
ncbi:hypothetical protein IM660_13130 [Ruania alkalisoli]|uniref:Uncharacterized protein n=1 Tax=Ruania alkalisoli TaxID=2779775 RepID=A0A7M1SPX8_9MICO|nr:hypothetical protein [Ruania alkalisoli]QOR69616.1 hypothetical protein IM660_13130 [Ruania alkalisoli]